jgi:hypothetical protein
MDGLTKTVKIIGAFKDYCPRAKSPIRIKGKAAKIQE